MPKKITYIITNSDRAGAQQHVRSLIEHFSSEYDCELISGTRGYLSEYAEKLGINTHIIPQLFRNISLVDDARAWDKLRRYLKESRPDIVHLHSAKAGFLGRLAAVGLGIKVIYTVHGWAFSDGNSWAKKVCSILLESLVSKVADKIILVSEYDYALALKYRIVPMEKLVVIHNGVADNFDKDLQFEKTGPFHLVSLVRFVKQKNLPCMIQGINEVNREIKVSIAGTGQLNDYIEKMIEELGLSDRVDLLGEISDIELLLCAGDAFILSSDWEGLPISIIEACRAGLPIISTNVGGVNEIVDCGENGILVPANQPGKLAKAITKLIDNKPLSRKMGRRSREIYEERFTVGKMLRNTQSVYDECARV